MLRLVTPENTPALLDTLYPSRKLPESWRGCVMGTAACILNWQGQQNDLVGDRDYFPLLQPVVMHFSPKKLPVSLPRGDGEAVRSAFAAYAQCVVTHAMAAAGRTKEDCRAGWTAFRKILGETNPLELLRPYDPENDFTVWRVYRRLADARRRERGSDAFSVLNGGAVSPLETTKKPEKGSPRSASHPHLYLVKT